MDCNDEDLMLGVFTTRPFFIHPHLVRINLFFLFFHSKPSLFIFTFIAVAGYHADRLHENTCGIEKHYCIDLVHSNQ